MKEAKATGQEVGDKTKVKMNKNFERKIVNIFLLINFIICCRYSKEPSQ